MRDKRHRNLMLAPRDREKQSNVGCKIEESALEESRLPARRSPTSQERSLRMVMKLKPSAIASVNEMLASSFLDVLVQSL